MHPYLTGKYWWLGVAAIAIFTLLLFHTLVGTKAVTQKTPQPSITQQPIVKPTVKVSVPTHPVLELFNPSADNISRDQAISRVRGELEQLLVIAIMLQRCDQLSDVEYHSIHLAGQRYAERTRLFHDGDVLMRELAVSAERTYALVYAGTSCDEASLPALKAQTMAWQAQYTTTPSR